MRLAIAAVAALGVGACTPDIGVPAVASISPGWGWNGETTSIVVRGANFYPSVRAVHDGVGGTDDSFELWLDGPERIELESVELLDFESLSGVVPAALPVGLYDVEAHTPSGLIATLADAFEVTATRADHLTLSAESDSYQVDDWVVVNLELNDPEGDVVAVDAGESGFEVEVQLAADDIGQVRFLEGTLIEQEELESGDGIRGRLDLDGLGFVSFTSEVPQTAQILVAPADETSIDSATGVVSWRAGAPNQVRIELPRDDYSTVAGASFDARLTLLDANGIETSGATASLLLYDLCASTFQAVSLADRATVTVQVTEASGTTACASQRLIAQGSGAYGESDVFEVIPDEPVDLQVTAWPTVLTAGSDTLKVLVAAQDQWGNALIDTSGSLDLIDDAGGLDPDNGIGEQDCEDFTDGLAFCTAVLWRAADVVTITARSAGGLVGVSGTIEVLPSSAQVMSVVVEELTVTAGAAFPAVVKVSDGFGNPLDIDPTGGDTPVFTDQDGTTLSCSYIGPAGTDNAEQFGCIATVARVETVSASVPARSVSGVSDPFNVVNGELAAVEVDIGGVASVAAGAALPVTASAVDAWGNAYVVQSDDTLTLSDLSGSISPETLTMNSAGVATGNLTFTKATTDNRVTAIFAGGEAGISPSFSVVAGSLDHIEIEPTRTWAWVGVPMSVLVRAVDAWDNPVSTYTGSPTVTSSRSLGTSVAVGSLSTGEAEVEFDWSRAGLQDTLRLTDGSRSAVSSAVDVLDDSCTKGPVAALTVGGVSTTTTLCRTGGTTATTSVSASGSTAGAAALAAYHFDLGDGSWRRQSGTSLSTTWEEEGRFDVSMVVADALACGAQVDATVWVADDDGEPAGPVTIEVADESLVAGSATDGVTSVDLTAYDCTGDVSRYGTLYVRSDLGEVQSTAVSTVASTGEGLSVALDSSGQGTVDWSLAGSDDDGDATIYAGVLSGGAMGSATAEVSGESRRPIVLEMTPYGSTSDLVDAIVVTFSEPMLTSSATTSRVLLSDPDGVSVALADEDLSFDADETVLTVTLPELLDAARGGWLFTLSSGVRDSAGNQLDGQYTGSASAFSLEFGAVSDTAPATTACTPDTDTITPDGDPGTGVEADECTLSLTADAAVVWWRSEVEDEAGQVVRVAQLAGGSTASGTWTFDGRDQQGKTLAAGTYTVTVIALDASWNEGDSCSTELEIVHRYGS